MRLIAALTVRKAQRPINIRADRVSLNSSDVQYTLHVADKDFGVDGKLLEYVKQGEAYAIYYVEYPNTDTYAQILSLERIAASQ